MSGAAYAYPSYVNAASFVSIKLSGNTNYREWQEQMVCLVDSHDMMCFIDGTLKEPQETNDSDKKVKYREWKRSDTLVKGWIFGSLSEGVMATVLGLGTANEVWDKLKATYNTPATPSSIEKAEAYPYPSHVNVSNFVSVKLDDTNYDEWEAQMKCLLESYDMLCFIDGTLEEAKIREQKRSDTIVKGWIFGSLSKDVMEDVVGLNTANEVWNKLKTTYGAPNLPKDSTRYFPLYRAIMTADWEEAREILNEDKEALTAKLNLEGYSALHIAVHECKDIQFVESLLNEITPESLPTMLTDNKFNALHCAAMVGNTEAAKMLVEKNPNLLFMVDGIDGLPILRAVANSHISTFLYLRDACIQHIEISQQVEYHSPFEGKTAALLLNDVINTGCVDVARELINKYPAMATTKHEDFPIPLTCIAGKGDLYYSGKKYNFYQRFVYAHVPTEINVNINDTNNIEDMENQSQSVTNRKRYFYYVAHVKHLQEAKVTHNKALILLKFICEEFGKLDEKIDVSNHYGEAFYTAVANNIPETVDEIMRYFPQAVWTRSEGYFATQIAIRDRCHKVHNVLLDHLTQNKYLLHGVRDDDSNTFSHLAARLAPLPIRNLIPGAALQMQRELQWFKGVEKFDRHQSRFAQNKKGETPIMMFRREHMELRKEGEVWMKKTADSYTITAALIITIVFAAAITVPGGNDNSGKANYAPKPSFFIFIVSDAISLFTSTTSLLLFLSILTMRYRDEDFLYRLPKRLILGLTMLFLSVTSMMVAFGATLYLTFGQGRAWILYPVAALTCLPIASFVTLQLPLLLELINSTYYHGIFSENGYHRI